MDKETINTIKNTMLKDKPEVLKVIDGLSAANDMIASKQSESNDAGTRSIIDEARYGIEDAIIGITYLSLDTVTEQERLLTILKKGA